MLEICMLGTFDVSRGGIPLEGVQVRRGNRLLALLVLEQGRRVNREWIEQVLDMSYDALRKAESALRSCLGSDMSCFTVASNSLSVDNRNSIVDVFEFEKLIGLGDENSLLEAVRVYKGGLLKDWDDGWILEKREELHLCYLDALQTLIKSSIRDREYERASSLLRRFTHICPYLDFAWGQLIDVYRLAGRFEDAKLAYSAYLAGLEARGREEQRVIPPSSRVADALTLSSIVTQHEGSSTNSSVVRAPMDTYFEHIGGAVPLTSSYYIHRTADDLAATALAPQTSFILIKGARQVGKTSLLARVLQYGRDQGASVILSDLQNLTQDDIESSHSFLRRTAESIASQLGLNSAPGEFIDPDLPMTVNFERFLLRQVLPAVNGWLIWGIDETDRLFECKFKDDIFGMMRTWHNKRSLDPGTNWERLTVVLSYATEVHLIQNLNQSPFNVGFPVELADFTIDEVSELNRRYGEPLRDSQELSALFDLVGGHPLLARQCLLEMTLRRCSISAIEANASMERGIFRAHLERMRLALLRDPELTETVRAWIHNGVSADTNSFVRLCAAGVMAGDTPETMHFRCKLYEQFLRRVL